MKIVISDSPVSMGQAAADAGATALKATMASGDCLCFAFVGDSANDGC